jgi:hypothetical protein
MPSDTDCHWTAPQWGQKTPKGVEYRDPGWLREKSLTQTARLMNTI